MLVETSNGQKTPIWRACPWCRQLSEAFDIDPWREFPEGEPLITDEEIREQLEGGGTRTSQTPRPPS